MLERIVIIFLLGLITVPASSQHHVDRKGRLFFYWGYNRSAYTSSDFHISGEGYDLTFTDIEGYDRPTAFSYNDYIKPENISKPQYVYRLGYYINDRWSISAGMDHTKYFMKDEQMAGVSGYVDASRSDKYAGTYDGSEMLIPWRMLWFHHSDGLNYASIEVEYNLPVWVSIKKNFYVDLVGNVGAGLVVPKTYVMVLDEEVDNKFHIAGGGANVKLGGRFTFWSNFFFETAFKAGYAWMPNILVNDYSNAKAKQNVGWLEYYAAFGFSVPLIKQNSTGENP